MDIDIEVLNAAADDWEALDQIFLSIRFECAPHVAYPAVECDYSLRTRRPETTLKEIANSIHRLWQSGDILAKRERGVDVASLTGGDVLECWFRTSQSGKQKLLAYAASNVT